MEDNSAKDRRIEGLTEYIRMKAFDAVDKIPETVIDNFIDKVVYEHGVFIWHFNSEYSKDVYRQETSDWKKRKNNENMKKKSIVEKTVR